MPERTATTQILRTKLHRPPLTDDLVPRPQLLAKLEKGRQRPLTLISAPAGYGKSTLMSSWLAEGDFQNAWLSLDEKDNDLRLFLTYFLTAVQSCFSEIGQETRALLESAKLPPLSILSNSLINELNRINEAFVLVLDDYHLIDKKAVHELISELLRYPPQLMHLVLSVRRDPPLPLARLRGQNQVTDIRVPQLRFTAAETAAFLQKNVTMSVDDDVANLLEEKTEGWVTGLRLATLFLRQQTDIDLLLKNLPGNTLHIANYLLAEVLSHLEPAIQDFLLKTSILDQLCGPLCDTVAELEEPVCDGQAYMVWLVEQNLFTIPLDDDGIWYRYHHLFQQLLQRELKNRLDERSINLLHIRASKWFAENDFIGEAIDHALAAEDVSAAVQLIEENRHLLLNEDHWYILEKWLEKLPEGTIITRPKLLLARAWVFYFKFIVEAIPPVLETIETLLNKETMDQAVMGELNFFRGNLLFWIGESESAIEYIRKALEWIPAKNSQAKSEAEIYLALSLQMNGQEQQAVEALQKKLYYDKTLEDIYKIRLLASLTFTYLISGDLTKALQTVPQLVDVGKKGNNKYTLAWSNYLLALIYYKQNSLKDALSHFQVAMENRYILHSRAAIDSMCGLALSYQALNQVGKAKKTLDLLLEFALYTQNPVNITVANSIHAHLSLLQGDLRTAVQHIQTADLTFDAGIMLFWLEIPRITHCHVMVDQGTEAGLRKATEKLQEYRQLNEATHNTAKKIEILLLQALVYKKQKQIDEALTALKQAVTLAHPGGWIRPFLELGPEIAEMLRKLDAEENTLGYVRQLLDAFTKENLGLAENVSAISEDEVVSKPTQSQSGDLSNREIDVLILLSQRLSNKEIAEQLSISPGTVKRHTITIYHKLGVNSRRQAVSKAVALGIISPS